MGIANKILPHYTIEDWQHWEGRWELIEGHPIAMSPSPTPGHQRISAKMIAKLENATEASGCQKCNVYNFLDYKIADDIILEPNILIVCGEITKKYLDFPPALVVEILSPFTALRDRNTKFELYQQQGVKYYLMIDVNKKEIEVYRLENGSYKQEEGADSKQFEFEDCAIALDFNNIFQ
jgi:Uma2 family endonuclease